jgi:hypothetical protein
MVLVLERRGNAVAYLGTPYPGATLESERGLRVSKMEEAEKGKLDAVTSKRVDAWMSYRNIPLAPIRGLEEGAREGPPYPD